VLPSSAELDEYSTGAPRLTMVRCADLREALTLISSVAIAAKQQKVMNPDMPNPIYDMFDPAMMEFELP
jgi:hypothetical protein